MIVRTQRPKLYVSYQTLRYESSESGRTGFMPTSDKENTIFYLKLQWISAKDDAERESLGKKIRELLAAAQVKI